MNMFFVVVGLSVCILAIALVGMAFNIIFRNKKFPNGSVGKNPELRKKGLNCAKCGELKRCSPKLKEKAAEKDARMKQWDELLKL